MPEGRQSPEPSTQSGAQKDAPSNASGLDAGIDTKEKSKKDLESLGSNPKGPLEEHRKATVSKTLDNATENSKA